MAENILNLLFHHLEPRGEHGDPVQFGSGTTIHAIQNQFNPFMGPDSDAANAANGEEKPSTFAHVLQISIPDNKIDNGSSLDNLLKNIRDTGSPISWLRSNVNNYSFVIGFPKSFQYENVPTTAAVTATASATAVPYAASPIFVSYWKKLISPQVSGNEDDDDEEEDEATRIRMRARRVDDSIMYSTDHVSMSQVFQWWGRDERVRPLQILPAGHFKNGLFVMDQMYTYILLWNANNKPTTLIVLLFTPKLCIYWTQKRMDLFLENLLRDTNATPQQRPPYIFA